MIAFSYSSNLHNMTNSIIEILIAFSHSSNLHNMTNSVIEIPEDRV